MEKKDASFYKNKIITIPNILSLFRLFLIPVIIFCYFISQTNGHWYALIVFGVSALTDILDGIIARKYFYPLTNDFECYRELETAGADKTPVAKYLADRVLTLPLYADLSTEDIDRICDIILK